MNPLSMREIRCKPSTILNMRIVEICKETNALVGTGRVDKIKSLKDEASQIVGELKHRRSQVLEAACY